MTRLNPANPTTILQAAEIIKNGGLVAFPTETVYGLGANALDETAVRKIFEAKARPTTDPLIVHIAELGQLERIARPLSHQARALAEAFWPGPLTLLVPRLPQVPDLVTAGLQNVAVRIPDHAVALALIQAAGTPIAAPSANRFGHTSPTSAAHVLHDLDGRVDMILDGGATHIGVESTVLDLSTTPARILRPGGVTREMLEALIGPVSLHISRHKPEEGLPSPGLLKKHYAPRARMVLFIGSDADGALRRFVSEQIAAGRSVGVMTVDEDAGEWKNASALGYCLGPRDDLASIARHIYAGMRWLDGRKVDVIACCDFGTQGLGLAIRDRLVRAATDVIG